MGKWEAIENTTGHHLYHEEWGVLKMQGDGDSRAFTPFDKDQATRYALALNVADAGVDFGEFAIHLAHYRGNRHHSESPYATSAETTHNFYQALTYFEAIANAVEGDKTKEDV